MTFRWPWKRADAPATPEPAKPDAPASPAAIQALPLCETWLEVRALTWQELTVARRLVLSRDFTVGGVDYAGRDYQLAAALYDGWAAMFEGCDARGPLQ